MSVVVVAAVAVEEEVGNIGVAVVGTLVVVDRYIVLDTVVVAVVVVGRRVEVRLLAFVEDMLCFDPVC